MREDGAYRVREIVENLYRSDSRRILATLIRLLGDFDLAEDAMHDAFKAAMVQWPPHFRGSLPCGLALAVGEIGEHRSPSNRGAA